MNAWWATLGLEQQIYYGLGIIASALLLVQLVLTMVGAGAEELADAGDVDMDGPEDHPSGIHLLSSRTVLAFGMGFGWTGALRLGEGASSFAAVIAATAVGLLFAYAILRLMRFLHTLHDSGTLDYENAVGEVGSVYLEIHPALVAGGQVQVTVQGRLRVAQALTRQAAPIGKGARVRVAEIMDRNTLVVEPIAADPESQEN